MQLEAHLHGDIYRMALPHIHWAVQVPGMAADTVACRMAGTALAVHSLDGNPDGSFYIDPYTFLSGFYILCHNILCTNNLNVILGAVRKIGKDKFHLRINLTLYNSFR